MSFHLAMMERVGVVGLLAHRDLPKEERLLALSSAVRVRGERTLGLRDFDADRPADPANAFIHKAIDTAPRGGYGSYSWCLPATTADIGSLGVARPIAEYNNFTGTVYGFDWLQAVRTPDGDFDDVGLNTADATFNWGGQFPLGIDVLEVSTTRHPDAQGDPQVLRFAAGGPMVAHGNLNEGAIFSARVFSTIPNQGSLDYVHSGGLHTYVAPRLTPNDPKRTSALGPAPGGVVAWQLASSPINDQGGPQPGYGAITALTHEPATQAPPPPPREVPITGRRHFEDVSEADTTGDPAGGGVAPNNGASTSNPDPACGTPIPLPDAVLPTYSAHYRVRDGSFSTAGWAPINALTSYLAGGPITPGHLRSINRLGINDDRECWNPAGLDCRALWTLTEPGNERRDAPLEFLQMQEPCVIQNEGVPRRVFLMHDQRPTRYMRTDGVAGNDVQSERRGLWRWHCNVPIAAAPPIERWPTVLPPEQGAPIDDFAITGGGRLGFAQVAGVTFRPTSNQLRATPHDEGTTPLVGRLVAMAGAATHVGVEYGEQTSYQDLLLLGEPGTASGVVMFAPPEVTRARDLTLAAAAELASRRTSAAVLALHPTTALALGYAIDDSGLVARGWHAALNGTALVLAGRDDSGVAATDRRLALGGYIGMTEQGSDPAAVAGEVQVFVKTGGLYVRLANGTVVGPLSATTGTVTGPGSSTDTALVRWNGTTGTALLNSTVTLDGSGNLAGVGNLTLTGTVDGRDVSADGAVLDAHVASTSNPHLVTKTQVGLGNVSNDAQLKIASNLSDLANASTARTNLGLGTMAVATATDYLSKAGNLSGLADTSVARTNLGLGTMAVATATDYLAKADNLSGLANTGTARTNLGVAIGTDVQAYSAALASIAGLTTAADKGIYTTGSNTYATFDFTAFARTLMDDADASAARTTLGLGTVATESTVPVGKGGTGVTSLTSGALLLGGSTVGTLAVGTAYHLLRVNAGGTAYETALLSNSSLSDNTIALARLVNASGAGFIAAGSAGAWAYQTTAGATALLDEVIGDSGAGGTKGLVPAPDPGDAAAGKFLSADGSWVAPGGRAQTHYTADATLVGNEYAFANRTAPGNLTLTVPDPTTATGPIDICAQSTGADIIVTAGAYKINGAGGASITIQTGAGRALAHLFPNATDGSWEMCPACVVA